MSMLVTARPPRQRDGAPRQRDDRSFLLQRAQPAMTGLIDVSLSTLGAGISMAFSEGLSDTGNLTGRGSPHLRGSITGAGTLLGGVLHTLPFLIPAYHAALVVALAAVAFELVTLAWIRARFFSTGFLRSFISVALGGAIIAAASAALGAVG